MHAQFNADSGKEGQIQWIVDTGAIHGHLHLDDKMLVLYYPHSHLVIRTTLHVLSSLPLYCYPIYNGAF